jgi:5-methylcytosine-specific restriction endonuclease McrA
MDTIVCCTCKKEKPFDCFYGRAAEHRQKSQRCISCRYAERGRPVLSELKVRVPVRTVSHKKCSKCAKMKRFVQFYREKKSADGFASSCIACFCATVGRSVQHYRRVIRLDVKRTATHKECSDCRKLLPHFEFYLAGAVRTKDGFQAKCKPCMRASDARYRKTPAYKKFKQRQDQRYRETMVVGSTVWWKVRFGRKTHVYPKGIWVPLMQMFNAHPYCVYCGVALTPGQVAFDHKIPRSKGGSLGIENLAVSCVSCNDLKKAMTADEFEKFLPEYAKRVLEMRTLRLVEKVGG